MSARCTIPLLACLLALGCADDGNNPQIRIELVDTTGENAAFGVIEGRLRVQVRQGDAPLSCVDGACEAEIHGGDFDLSLPIESFDALTRIQAWIDGGAEPLAGAVPEFAVVGESLETGQVPVRVVMMPLDRCLPMANPNISSDGPPRLVTPRRDMAAVVRRNIVLLAGGVEDGGAASSRVDFFDQVVVEMRPPLMSAPGALGAARGIALPIPPADRADRSLVVGASSFLWEAQDGPPAAQNIDLHEGADFSSALVLVDDEVAVIGGTDTNEITWVTDRGIPIRGRVLTEARAFAAAAAGDGGALVVGGGPGGEWIEPSLDPPVPVDGLPDGTGGWLAASPSRRTFLWIGAHGADTWLIGGCPTACNVVMGPTWPRPREGASGLRTAAGTFWIVGGDASLLVERVLWTGEAATIVEGPDLSVPRAGAALAEHESGVVLVIGGEGPDGMHEGVEMCMPEMGLDPL